MEIRVLGPRDEAEVVGTSHLFDDAVKKALAQRDDIALVDYQRLGRDAAATAVPTPDHYFPFLYALGASDTLSEKAVSDFAGFQSGTLSMRCVQFGA